MIEDKYTDYDKFSERIGILDEDQLIALGWDADNGNRICYSRHEELVQFMEKLNSNAIDFIKGGEGKKYHIATDLDAGGVEGAYCEAHNIDADSDITVIADSIVNKVAFVNRMDYFLCDGDANEDLFLECAEEM